MKLQNLTGQTLGQYELKEMLGHGGMGMVYRAYQPALDRYVAIKVLASMLDQEEGFEERFNREAKMAASLEHPHIVSTFDYGIEGDISYVVMRLLTGGTLEHRLRRSEMLTLQGISKMLKQVAGALDHAHRKGVLHRDIKPSNIMFDERGDAYVVDFGIAKLLQTTNSLTKNSVLLGTPSYMSPEQWLDQPLTGAADEYALAVLTYKLLTGELPFEATTPYAVMNKHLNEFPTPPQVIRQTIPLTVSVVVQRALSKVVDDRYESVTAFADAFDDAVNRPELTSVAALPPMRPLVKQISVSQPPATQFGSREWFNRIPPLTGIALLISVMTLLVIVLLLVIRLSEPPLPIGRSEPTTAAEFFERGMAEVQKNNYGNAIDLFTRAVELQPDYTDALYWRGYSYYYNDLYDNALLDLNRVIVLDAEYTNAYITLGDLYYFEHDYEDSLVSYRAALNLDETNAFALEGLGDVLTLEDCREDWLPYYRLYIDLVGSDAEIHVDECIGEFE